MKKAMKDSSNQSPPEKKSKTRHHYGCDVSLIPKNINRAMAGFSNGSVY